MVRLQKFYLRLSLCLLMVCVFLSAQSAQAKNVLKKDVRKLDVLFEFKLNIVGGSSTSFELIALVPQSVAGRQNVGKIQYSPEPKKVFSQAGNSYAVWKFHGKSMPKRIEMRCVMDIYKYKLEDQIGGVRLPYKEKKSLLRREKYLDVGRKSIKKAALSVGEFSTDTELARALTIYVTKRMSPTKAARKIQGAEKALKSRKGDCTEYTDLLVTLARQRGLPAKHISGYMVEKKTTVGHSWAEIFTREHGWIMIDPLHIDLRSGKFKELENKYIALSDLRYDDILNGGMIYSWKVNKGKGAKVNVSVKVTDIK